MTTNKQDKTLTEDQAFIQSLYDEVSDQDSDDLTEYPSKQLDHAILEAAHKAVSETPSDQQSNVQSLQPKANKRKKIAWYFPLATAASVLLVITVMNYQLNGPTNPVLETASTIDSTTQIKPNTPEMTSAQTMESDMFIVDVSDKQATKVQALTSSDKRLMSRSHEVEQPTKSKMSSSPRAEEEQAVSATQFLARNALKHEVLSKENMNSLESPTLLTYQHYQDLKSLSKDKKLYWRLRKKDKTSVVIELFQSEQASIFYQLNKDIFQLDESQSKKEKTFDEIIYRLE